MRVSLADYVRHYWGLSPEVRASQLLHRRRSHALFHDVPSWNIWQRCILRNARPLRWRYTAECNSPDRLSGLSCRYLVSWNQFLLPQIMLQQSFGELYTECVFLLVTFTLQWTWTLVQWHITSQGQEIQKFRPTGHYCQTDYLNLEF